MTPENDMDGPWKLPEVTGHPPGMLQDDSRDLSKWLAGKPGAKSLADEAAAGIAAQRVELLGPEPEQTFPAEVEALAVAAQEVLRLGMQCGEQWDQLAAAVYDYANLTAARERLAREDAQPAAVSAQVSVPRELFEAWRGLCFGTDWNRGTAAGYHRRKIEVGMRKLCSIPGEPSSFAAQPAPEPAEPVAAKLLAELDNALAFNPRNDEDGEVGPLSTMWLYRLRDYFASTLTTKPVGRIRFDESDGTYRDESGRVLLKSAPAKPLTEERIVMDGLMMLPNDDAADCAKAFAAGVRFAERAHGITAPSAAEGGSNARLSG